jgi:hypothetical protein
LFEEFVVIEFPTRVHLNSRGVACPLKCVIYSEADEDSLHALFTRPRVSQVWHVANLTNIVDDIVNEYDYTTSIIFCLLD